MEGINNKPGIIPQTFKYIFEQINEMPVFQFKISIAYIQLYKEEIDDLLNENNKNLKIKEIISPTTRKKMTMVEGTSWFEVKNVEDSLKFFSKGSGNRKTSSHALNNQSSRSHATFICRIQREMKNSNDSNTNKKTDSFLFLVDLAGSERITKTKADKEVAQEAKTINLSLLTLGQCIEFLAKGKDFGVNYKDSKLTLLLKDSLGGNCKTSLIVNVSPSSYNVDETYSSLNFAQKASTIKNLAQINVVSTLEDRLKQELEEAKKEIKRLQEENENLKKKNFILEQENTKLKSEPNSLTDFQDSTNTLKKKKKKKDLNTYNDQTTNDTFTPSKKEIRNTNDLNTIAQHLDQLEKQLQEEREKHEKQQKELDDYYKSQLNEKDQQLQHYLNKLSKHEQDIQSQFDKDNKYKQFYNSLANKLLQIYDQSNGIDLEKSITALINRDKKNRIDNSIINKYIQEIQKEISRLIKEKEKVTSKLSQNQKLLELSTQTYQTSSDNSSTEKENKKLQKKEEELSNQIDVFSKLKKKYELIKDSEVDDNNKTQLLCEQYKAETQLSLLETYIDKYNQEIKSKEKKINELKTELKNYKKNTKTLPQDKTLLYSTTGSETLQKTVSELIKENSQLKNQINSTQNNISEKEQTIEGLNIKINEKDNIIEKYKRDLDTYDNTTYDLNQEISQMKRQLNDMEANKLDIEALKGSNSKQKEIINHQDKVIKDLNLKQEQLVNELENYKSDITNKKRKIENYENEINSIKLQILDHDDDLNKYKNKLEKNKTKYNDAKSKIEGLNQMVQNANESLETEKQFKDQLHQELKNKTNEIIQLQKKNKELNTDLQNNLSKLRETLLDYERQQKKLEAQTKEIKSAKDEIETQNLEISNLKTANKKQELLIEELEEQNKELESQLLDSHKKNVNNLSLVNNHRLLQGEKLEKDQIINSLEKEIEDQSKTIEKLKKENNKHQKEKEKLELETSKINSEYDKQELKLKEYENLIHTLKDSMLENKTPNSFCVNLLSYMTDIIKKSTLNFLSLRTQLISLNNYILDNQFPIQFDYINIIIKTLKPNLEMYITDQKEKFINKQYESITSDIVEKFNSVIYKNVDETIRVLRYFEQIVPKVNVTYDETIKIQNKLLEAVKNFEYTLPQHIEMDNLRNVIEFKIKKTSEIIIDFEHSFENINKLIDGYVSITSDIIKYYVKDNKQKGLSRYGSKYTGFDFSNDYSYDLNTNQDNSYDSYFNQSDMNYEGLSSISPTNKKDKKKKSRK